MEPKSALVTSAAVDALSANGVVRGTDAKHGNMSKDCEMLPRLEFHSNIQWAQAYQRNNKANGQKNLRCFPNHCQGLGHQRGFCGHSIVINFYYLPQSVQGQLYSFAHFCIADCELNSPAAAAAKGISRERFKAGDVLSIEQVRTKIRQADEPLLEYIEGLELQDRRIDADGSVRVNFEFNRNLKGWHYGFLGSKLTRNVYHNFRAYVLELIPGTQKRPEHYRVLAAVTSPKWKLFCRRRNRTGVLPPKMENGIATKLENSRQTRLPMNSPPLPTRRAKKRREVEPGRLTRHSAPQTSALLRHQRTVPLQARRYPSDAASSEGYSSGQGAPPHVSATRHISQQQRQPSQSQQRHVYGSSTYHSGTYQDRYLHGGVDDFDPPMLTKSQRTTQDSRMHAGQTRHSTAWAEPPAQAYGVKQYVRRLASQERLNVSGRSRFSKKRTSSEPSDSHGPSSVTFAPSQHAVHPRDQQEHIMQRRQQQQQQQRERQQQQQQQQQQKQQQQRERQQRERANDSCAWASCFAEPSMSRSQSIPQLEVYKASSATNEADATSKQRAGSMNDPRQVCLYELLRMVNFSIKNAEPHASLSLRDHGDFQHFSATTLDLAQHWLAVPPAKASLPCAGPGLRSRSSHSGNDSPSRSPCDDYILNEVGFSKFLVDDGRFGARIVKFAREQPLEQRRHDPYGTVAFMLNILKAFQNVFLGHCAQPDPEFLASPQGVESPASRTGRGSSAHGGNPNKASRSLRDREEKTCDEIMGSLYPVMSTLSLRQGLDSLLEADRLSPRNHVNNQSHFSFSHMLSSSSSSGRPGTSDSTNTAPLSGSNAAHERDEPNATLTKSRPAQGRTTSHEVSADSNNASNSDHHDDVGAGTADLERFTQDLEVLASGDADDLTLRATKSWKTLSTAKLTHKLSQNFSSSLYGTRVSEHSLLHAASFLRPMHRNASIFSFSNLPSALNILSGDVLQSSAALGGIAGDDSKTATEKASQRADQGRHAHASRKQQTPESSMKELDDFLKKECGVQEVEEVDVPSLAV